MNKPMNLYDVSVAAHNIKSIEDSLGHPIPAYLMNNESLGDHVYNLFEVETAAHNIKSIMDLRSRKPIEHDPNMKLGFFGTLLALGLTALLFYVAISIIYATFSVIL